MYEPIKYKTTMKKIYLLLFLLSAGFASANNFFTMGVNDTVRIRPQFLGAFVNVTAKAHFDGRLDTWNLTVSYPVGLQPEEGFQTRAIEPGTDLTMVYKNYYNHDTLYVAQLNVSSDFTSISSTIPVIGYHDYNNDGIMDPYGTVKWESGDYDDMFVYRFGVNYTFRNGYVALDGILSSNSDMRQGLISPNPYWFYKQVYFYVGYKVGDVNGDEQFNISDVNLLISHLNDPDTYVLDEFQMAAADWNGDGEVNVTDSIDMINYILNN